MSTAAHTEETALATTTALVPTIDEVKFHIRIIDWSLDYYNELGEDRLSTPIILQDINGPCPLIALINTLSITYELKLKDIAINSLQSHGEKDDEKLVALKEFKSLLTKQEAKSGFIELKTLLSQLGDLILVYNNEKHIDDQDGIDKILSNLPILHTGLSVNPNLINGDFVQHDLASRLFELFDLKFKHGWIINQIESENEENWNVSHAHIEPPDGSSEELEVPPIEDNYAKLITLFNELQSFDEIQDYLLIDEDEGIEKLQNQRLINKWLDLNKTQLTPIGLTRLNQEIVPEEAIIFFRNNHFNTLFKKGDKDMYLLITDTSFNNKSNKIVWQSFNSVSGKDDLFFSGDFLPILELDANINDEGYNDNDYLLLKQLQEEEDEQLAKQMQQVYTRKVSDSNQSKNKNSKDKKSKDKKSKPKKVEQELLIQPSTSNQGATPNQAPSSSTKSNPIKAGKADNKKSGCIIV
ncbi:hypothetical protein DFJ63DRAFT_314959 [Scheffersomyces coipomensis]|uniref:uncharacterized protein n=1 Tax=Scheffersomyces coipomensis TaxID=1788519 RepID=UPI00315C5A1A